MNNQDKKEILKIIASCAWSEQDEIFNPKIFRTRLEICAESVSLDKPERKMPPENGEHYLEITKASDKFIVFENSWVSSWDDSWGNPYCYHLSERELAEKKCEELNRVLKS